MTASSEPASSRGTRWRIAVSRSKSGLSSGLAKRVPLVATSGRRSRRARSTRARLRRSSSRRPWRWSSTWRRPGKPWARRSSSARAASISPASTRRASGPFVAAGQDVEAFGVGRDFLPARLRFAFRLAEGGGRQELAEVAVAGAVFGQQRQARARGDGVAVATRDLAPSARAGSPARERRCAKTLSRAGAPPPLRLLREISRGADAPCIGGESDFGADQGFEAGFFGGLPETGGAVEAVAVHQGDGGEVELGGARDEVFGEGGAVEEGERRSATELGPGEGGGGGGAMEITLAQLFLAGAGGLVGAAAAEGAGGRTEGVVHGRSVA